MAQRHVLQTITVVRDGKRVTPKIGEPFDFTGDEIKEIEKVQPTAFRKLIDESKTDASSGSAPSGNATGTGSKPAGKSGKTGADDL
jgi:hypothetical protein